MAAIINFAYTHVVPVTEDNVVELLAAADQFLIPGISQMCCSFLEDQLCPMNCIGIWRLMDFYYLPELKHTAFLYILHHFREIACVSEELIDLSVQQLAAIIGDDRLKVHIFELLPKVTEQCFSCRCIMFGNSLLLQSLHYVRSATSLPYRHA